MTSSFSAKVSVDARDNTRAIFESINADNEFYPENPTRTAVKLNKTIEIDMDSDHLPHLRASLNSMLRLIRTCNDSIESVRDGGGRGSG